MVPVGPVLTEGREREETQVTGASLGHKVSLAPEEMRVAQVSQARVVQGPQGRTGSRGGQGGRAGRGRCWGPQRGSLEHLGSQEDQETRESQEHQDFPEDQVLMVGRAFPELRVSAVRMATPEL